MTKAARPLLYRLIVDPLWAGLIGAGSAMWIGAALLALREMKAIERSMTEGLLALFALPIATFMGVRFGFRGPVASYPGLVGRIVGTLLLGLLVFVVAVIGLETLHRSLRSSSIELPPPVMLAALGAPLAAIAMLRYVGREGVRAIAIAPRARVIAIAAASVVAQQALLWPAFRCYALFSEEACWGEAMRARKNDDRVTAASLLARGCSLGDGDACALAANEMADLVDAEALLDAGCSRGDEACCDALDLRAFAKGCSRHRASACRAAGDLLHRKAQRGEARGFYERACLLGDEPSCAR